MAASGVSNETSDVNNGKSPVPNVASPYFTQKHWRRHKEATRPQPEMKHVGDISTEVGGAELKKATPWKVPEHVEKFSCSGLSLLPRGSPSHRQGHRA